MASAFASMGTLYQRSMSLASSGGLSYARALALQDELDAKRTEAAQLKAQLMMEQVIATDSSWQRLGNNDSELLIR